MKDRLFEVICQSGYRRLIWGVSPQEALEQMRLHRREKSYNVFEVDLNPHNQDTFAKSILVLQGA
jgi:hypothetical protein